MVSVFAALCWENIYFYHEQYSNQRVLSEVANFDFDNLNAYEKEVHVWFSTFDAYDFDFNDVVDFFVKCKKNYSSEEIRNFAKCKFNVENQINNLCKII